jgi:hypothetical protein
LDDLNKAADVATKIGSTITNIKLPTVNTTVTVDSTTTNAVSSLSTSVKSAGKALIIVAVAGVAAFVLLKKRK